MQLTSIQDFEKGLPSSLKRHLKSVLGARQNALSALSAAAAYPSGRDDVIAGPGWPRIKAIGDEISFMGYLALTVIASVVVACGLMAWLSHALSLGVESRTLLVVSLALIGMFAVLFGFGYWQIRTDARRRMIEAAAEAIVLGEEAFVVHDRKSGARTLTADAIGSASFESRDAAHATLRIGGRNGESLLVMHDVAIEDARRLASIANGWGAQRNLEG